MSNQKFKKYVINIVSLLKDLAKKEKIIFDSQKERAKDYSEGVIMGYCSIIILLKQEAFAFCIDQRELGLADIDPEVDLLGLDTIPDGGLRVDNWAIEKMSEEKVKGYLIDSIVLLMERALEAKKEADDPKEGYEIYNKGELKAYCTLFSLLKLQATEYNIDEKELGIDEIDKLLIL